RHRHLRPRRSIAGPVGMLASTPATPGTATLSNAIDGCTNLAACPLGVGALSTGLTAASFYNISASQHGFIGADIQGIAAKTAGGNIFNSVPFGAAHQNVSASSSLRSTMGFRIRRSRSLITPEEASPSELKKTPSK